MIYQLITIVAVVLAGLWSATRLTVVGFGVASTILAASLVLWTLLAGIDAKGLIIGFGLWLLFNVAFFLSGMALNAFGGRRGQWRSSAISMKDAKSH